MLNILGKCIWKIPSYQLCRNIGSKPIINETVINSIMNGNNICVLGESNKNQSISPICGIIYTLINQKKTMPKTERKIEKYFYDVETVYNITKNDKNIKAKKDPKGVVVITPSPDIGIQRYFVFKELDTKKQLNMMRISSSLGIICPLLSHV